MYVYKMTPKGILALEKTWQLCKPKGICIPHFSPHCSHKRVKKTKPRKFKLMQISLKCCVGKHKATIWPQFCTSISYICVLSTTTTATTKCTIVCFCFLCCIGCVWSFVENQVLVKMSVSCKRELDVEGLSHANGD